MGNESEKSGQVVRDNQHHVVGNQNDLVPHTPLNHAKHHVTCGCWVEGKSDGRKTVCAFCGAAYEWAEVYSFPYFICYDCCNIVGTKPSTSNPSCLGTGHLVDRPQHNIVGRPDDLTKNGQ